MALPWDVVTACLGVPAAPNDLGQVILRRNEPEVEVAICKSLSNSDFAATLRGVLQDWEGDAAALFTESHSALMSALREWKAKAVVAEEDGGQQLPQAAVQRQPPPAPPPSPVSAPQAATDDTLEFLLEAARQLSPTPRAAPRLRPSLESCSTEDGTSGSNRTPSAAGKKLKNKWMDLTSLSAIYTHLASAPNPFDALRISQLAATATEIESSADSLIARICQVSWGALGEAATSLSSQEALCGGQNMVVLKVEVPRVVDQVFAVRRDCLFHLRKALEAALGLERPKRQEEGVEGFAAWDSMIFKLCADSENRRESLRQMLISHYFEG